MGILERIFAYSATSPLSFTHLFFWGFFIAVLAGYSLIYKQSALRNIYLLIVSLFFYFKTSGVFVVLLLFTICSDYLWGLMISRSRSERARKAYLTISVVLNLSLLCYFKYAYFFHQSVNDITGGNGPYFNNFAHFSNTFFGTAFSVEKLLVPVGVSFFTFQSLSYTIDMYRGNVTPVKNIFDYGFFVCFFPHLVAGPIVKAHDFLYQLYQPYKLTRQEFGMAAFWIMNGFMKKIIADYLAVNFIDRVFDTPNFYTGLEVCLGILGYSLQIYMDFSGYTDMAIGIALILGYRLKTNFKSPYKATSTSEFWKRWHISLSSWLQEYLYIPLGGNRHGSVGSYIALLVILCFLVLLSGKLFLFVVVGAIALIIALQSMLFPSVKRQINTNINLMVTMLLGGLWHGSSWLFIIWGGLNGVGLIAHKYWQKISPFRDTVNPFTKFFLMIATLLFISFTRIFFRSDSMQKVDMIFDRITSHFGAGISGKILGGYSFVLSVMLAGYLIHWIPERFKERYRNFFAALPVPYMCFVLVVAFLLTYQFMSGEMQPFIYFQF